MKFFGFKKTKSGSSRRWIAHTAEPWPGWSVIVDAETFESSFDKVKHLNHFASFYTDDWDAFAKVCPPDRHVVGKAHSRRP